MRWASACLPSIFPRYAPPEAQPRIQVSAQAIVPRVKRFIDNKGFDVPVLVYDAPNPDAINERFDLPGHIPVTLAFDKDGRLVDREDGEAGKERFEELMKHALGI